MQLIDSSEGTNSCIAQNTLVMVAWLSLECAIGWF